MWWLLTKFSRKTTSLPHLFPKDLLGSGLKPISTRRLIISGLAKTSNNGWRTAPDTISAARLKVSLKEICSTFDKYMCGCLFHKLSLIIDKRFIYLEFWNLIGTRNGSIFAVTHLIYSTSRDLLHTAGWTFGPGILICCCYRKVLDNVFGALYLAIEKVTKLTHIVYKCISSIQYNIFVFIDFRGIHFLHVDVWMYQGVYMTNSDRDSLS